MTITENPIQLHDDACGPGRWPELAELIGADLEARVPDHDRSGEIDREAFERLRDDGLTTALVPVEHGGGGASHAEMGAVLRTLGRYDASTALTLSMHSHLVAAQVWRHHHGADATGVFRAVTGGAILISTGASDWVGSNGSARRVDGGYVVDARKMPASGAEVGQIAVTSVRWDDAPDGPEVLHCSIPMSADGVRIERTWDALGMRATGSHTIVFDGVVVPDAAVSLRRPADRWHPVWNTVASAAMPLIMAVYAGVADAAVDAALDLVGGRADEHVTQLVGEMLNAHTTGIDAVDAMFRDSVDLRFDATDGHASRTLRRKTVAANAFIETVRLAIEATGGRGFSRSSSLERLHRDVHGCLFHPLPRAKQTRFSGRLALGLDPVG